MSKLQKDTITWFEVPVTDIARATAFYEKVFKFKTTPMEMDGFKMSMLPDTEDTKEPTVNGTLIQGEGYTPSHQGTMVYFNGGKDLSVALGRVKTAGGKVIKEKFSIGKNGFCGYFEDTEGNKVAMHSPS